MLKIFKPRNLLWTVVISMDITLFKMFVLDYKKHPFLIEPPLLFVYFAIWIGCLIFIHKILNKERKFKYFIKDIFNFKTKGDD